jgi:putative hydrolase of the HAD superfamily
MIKNIVFDLGNVLVKFDPDEILNNLFENDMLKDKLKSIVFKNSFWKELDRGTLSYEEFQEACYQASPEFKKEISLIMESWDKFLFPIEENIKLLHELKVNGYKLYILSNFHEKAFKEILSKYAFFNLFDGMVISYQVKLIKPEIEIYKILINKYNLIPVQTIFIDDTVENIRAAEKVGINTIHYKNHDMLKEELESKLSFIQAFSNKE